MNLSPSERLLLTNLGVLGAMGMTPPRMRIIAYKTDRSNYGAKGKKNSRKNRKKK